MNILDKEEFRVKLGEINHLVEVQDYKGAMQVVDSIDWRRVKNVRTLCVVGEIYAANKRYEESKEIFLLAYHRAPIGKNILYRLIEVSLKMGDIDEAMEFFDEYREVASGDTTEYILRYKIAKAKNASLNEQIRILEDYKEKEFTERWSYELAKLYYKAGDKQKCLDLCNEMVLWFNDGTYVMKALDLKQRMGVLTGEEKEKYEQRFIPKLIPPEKVQEIKESRSEEAAAEEKKTYYDETKPVIDTIKVDDERDLSGAETLQEKIANGIRDIFGNRRKPEEAEDTDEDDKDVSEDEEDTESAESTEEAGESEETAEKADEVPGEDITAEEISDVEYPGAADTEVVSEDTADEPEELSVSQEEETEQETQESDMIPESDKVPENAGVPLNEDGKPDFSATIKMPELKIPRSMTRATYEENLTAPVSQDTSSIFGSIDEVAAAVEAEKEEDIAEETEFNLEDTILAAAEKQGIDIPDYEEAGNRDEIQKENARIAELAQEEEIAEQLAEEVKSEADDTVAPAEEEEPVQETEAAGEVPDTVEDPEEKDPVQVEEVDDARIIDEADGRTEEVAETVEEPDVEIEDIIRNRVPDIVYDEEEDPVTEEDLQAAEAEFLNGPAGVKPLEEEEVFLDTSDIEVPSLEPEKPEPTELQKLFAGRNRKEEKRSGKVIESDDDEFLVNILGRRKMEEDPDDLEEEELTEPEAEAEAPQPEAEITTAAREEAEITAEAEPESEEEEEIDEDFDEEYEESADDEEEELTEEDRIEQFIKSIQPETDPTEIIAREKVLTDEEKQLFTYFVKVPGMKEQLLDALCDVQRGAADSTSRTGNVIVMGGRETGKTRLISSLIPAICKELNLEASKVAYIFAEDLNERNIKEVVTKLYGGFLVIENANQLSQETADELDAAMNENTKGMIVILEDEKIGMRKLIARYPKLAKKFTSMINIPVFTNDELVNFARVYTMENGFRIDQMAMLALYNLIGINQKADQPMSIGNVKTMLDNAMAKAQGGLFKRSKKRVDRDGYTVLLEKDFS